MYIVGDFLNPRPETDESFSNYSDAHDRMEELSAERENYVVGLWEQGEDYAMNISINSETFRA